MLKPALFLSAIAAVALVSAPSARAEIKLATVDMNQVFTTFYKTKDAEAKLNELKASSGKELEDRMNKLKTAMADINQLNQDMEKPELSKDGKAAKQKERDDKVAKAREMDRDAAEFRSTTERNLREQFMRMRKDIIDEIMKVVNDKIKAGGYDLVLDKSGISLGQIPVVLFSRPDYDFSKDVVDALNANAPKTPAAK